MLKVTFLMIRPNWEQDGNGGSGFTGTSDTGFTGSSGCGFPWSKQVVLDMASLVAENPNSLRAGKKLSI